MNTISKTLEDMRTLRLYGMYEAYRNSVDSNQRESMTIDEFVSALLTAESDDRRNRSVKRAETIVSFRFHASIEDIDYSIDRGLDRGQIMRLATMDFVRNHKELFITGSTGTGKSFFYIALGYEACSAGYRVLYCNTNKLISSLKLAKAKGTILSELKRIEKTDLLILDDFGLQPFDATGRMILLDIIEERYRKRSTIITSQIPVNLWYDTIGQSTVADALLDRIVHSAIRVELFGQSLRKIKTQKDLLSSQL